MEWGAGYGFVAGLVYGVWRFGMGEGWVWCLSWVFGAIIGHETRVEGREIGPLMAGFGGRGSFVGLDEGLERGSSAGF